MIDLMGRTFCFFILESQQNDEGEFNALIAVEGETGYYKTDWFWGDKLEIAEKIAHDRNKNMGISQKEAYLIILRSMRKGAVEKPRF